MRSENKLGRIGTTSKYDFPRISAVKYEECETLWVGRYKDMVNQLLCHFELSVF